MENTPNEPIKIKTTGVYCILCVATGKRYIGSAATCILNRWRQHRGNLKAEKHPNRYLMAAWRKHGETAFVFSVIELCESAECVDREQHYIIAFNAADRNHGYNLSPTAGSCLGVKHSEETIAKYRRPRSGAHRASISESWVNRRARGPVSAETRAKISAGNLGRKRSPETREKLRAANLGKKASEATRLKMRGRPPLTDKHRDSIRKAQTGKKMTTEHRAKLLAANTGRIVSKETRAKIGAKSRGRKHTAEALRKMSIANSGKNVSAETRAKISAGNRGKKLSAEHKAKLRAARLKNFAKTSEEL